MKTTRILLTLSIFIMAIGLSQPAAAESDTFTVELPCTDSNWGWFGQDCNDETIEIPNGRPIYALLVSGFDKNHNLDIFHYYNFARCLQRKGAYVHYAWWNNLLAPYMERPLHNYKSVPSYAPNCLLYHRGYPHKDMFPCGYLNWHPDKAIPAEDHQFQADATAFLVAIRDNNPDAKIILVGHSMGGDAVVRLADSMPDDFIIDLLAPIDPVGNRTCIPGNCGCKSDLTGGGYELFTRFWAAHEDWYDPPQKRQLGNNIKYLYHRWQMEFDPPWDHESVWMFDYDGKFNDQTAIVTDDGPFVNNRGLNTDGHGEIVGYRESGLGLRWEPKTTPIGVVAPDNSGWPRWLFGNRNCFGVVYNDVPVPYSEDSQKNNAQARVEHMKKWETDPNYLDDKGFAPKKPVANSILCPDPESVYCTYCRVSGDLCMILDTVILPDQPANHPPVADAGPDQFVECCGPCGTVVTLDGSDSTDPDGDSLTYEWTWNGGLANGVNPTVMLPTGLTTVTLTVSDGELADSNTVGITIVDTTPPDITCPVDVSIECPADTDPSVTGTATATDSCANAPVVTHIDSIVPGPGNTGVITRTWTAIDASGNSSSSAQIIIVEDTTPPVLTCPDDIAVSGGFGGAEVTYDPTATDECDANPAVTTDIASGSFFETGVTTVTATATDSSGNSSMCTFDVIVSCFGINEVEIKTEAGKKGDDIKIKGTFNPGVPIDLMIDDVMYTIDDGQGHVLEFFIPAGSFELEGKGDKDKYKFHSPKGSQPDIKAKFDFDKCKFEFKAKKVGGIDEITSTSLEIILQAGANIAQEIVELEVKGKKGEHLEYKRKPKFECCPEM